MYNLNGVKNPSELKIAIEAALQDNTDAFQHVYKYKWYNYYLNMYIKKDSEMDIENEKIFKELEEKYPKLHKEIEDMIDYEIEKLNHDID